MLPLASARLIQSELQALRRDLHAHPETAFEEKRTAGVVAARLEAWGIETHRGLADTGVVGVIRGAGSGEAIGLRADMDALPIAEANEFAHRSTVAGRMHGCGHDGHTAMLLGAARVLADGRDFDGTVYLIFQPAEEGTGGARVMIEQGLFERFPMHAVFGMHNWPGLPVGEFAVHAGAVMAGTDRFRIRIEGVGGHAAMPHLGADPVLAGAALVQAVQSVVARALDPLEAAVVSITCFHAGDTFNVLPGTAELAGTLRAFSPAVREKALTRLRELCAGIGAAFGVDIAFELQPGGYPPTINVASEAAWCVQAAAAVVGEDAVHTAEHPSMGAEDFAFHLQKRPGAYIWIGNGASAALHHPRYDFNDDILALGTAYWVELARRRLAREHA
ncbi:MAG: amidohydrolase [Azoarcus sp.]|jgi:hippurate hydrolase|nr:amidohydrolase [Azoarcus sp.]